MKNKAKVYLASGWFTPRTREILNNLEKILSAVDEIELYSPRRDGIVLPPNQKHEKNLRDSIFKENIRHIDEADLVFANIDSHDDYNDPGTVYEIGYAMAHNIPVIGFALGEDNVADRFKGITSGFETVITGYGDIDDLYFPLYKEKEQEPAPRVLFVGAGNDSVDHKLAAYIMESGANLRWVSDIHPEIYSRIDEIFEDVEYMIAVIDDRKSLVSWMIGQAYARNIPVVTYSDFNWGINVMLLTSIITHLRGTEELVAFLQQVKREGLESIPPFDSSQLTSM